IMMTPPSMPIIAESSYAFSAEARLLPDWKRRITVSPPIMLSAWPRPMSSRPSTRIENPPPLVSQSAPTASTSGPSHIARRRWWVRKRPRGTSETMRAKPNAPATRPSCQSARAALFAMSGRTAGKPPPEKMLEKVITQSRAVRDVTRPFMVNHCPVTSATTIRLDVQGGVARMTFDRPEVLNPGNTQFAADLGRAVAAIDARDDVRVVVMTGAARAVTTGVDLQAHAPRTGRVGRRDARDRADGPAGHRRHQRPLHRRGPAAGARVRLPARGRGRGPPPAAPSRESPPPPRGSPAASA